MILLKNILVATDFEPAAGNALRYGRALARAYGATLHVLHVTESVFVRAIDGYGFAAIPPSVQEEIEQAGRRQTEALLGCAPR